MKSATLACCIGVCVAINAAHGAPDAGAKARGQYAFYGHSVHSSLQSAHAHGQHYSAYLDHVRASEAASADPQVAKVAGETIRNYISTMRRHLAEMRRHATTLGDKEALVMLDDVDRNLAQADEHHAALHAVHAGETIDPAVAKQHVDKVNVALQKAKVEHDEVMQKIGDGT